MPKKKIEAVEEENKKVSAWWLILPLSIGIALIWAGFYFTHITMGTWAQMPSMITALLLLFIDGLAFMILLNEVVG